VGTPYWMAPEVIGDQPYGTRADVWSAGVVLRELLQRRPPYFDLPVFRAMYLIRTQVPPQTTAIIGVLAIESSWRAPS
jgi:serine/threonine protein kinase